MTASNTHATGMCLVCGHSADDHSSDTATCTGTGELCQCHGYDPDQHPAERIAARRESDTATTQAKLRPPA